MELYACGSNKCGQLGLCHLDDVSEPQKVPLPVELPATADVQMAGGGNHTLLLYDHKVLVAGDLDAVGLSGQEPTFSPLHLGFNCTAIGAGWDFSVFLSADGECYTAGLNTLGRSGGPGVSKVNLPADFGMAKKVWASRARIMLQDEFGAVCAWGNCRNIGQLSPKEELPKRICEMDGAREIAAGNRFVLALGPENQLCNFGVVVPVEHAAITEITALVSGWTSCAVKNDDTVLVIGNNSHQQRRVPNKSFSAVAAGSEHYLGLETESRLVHSWGWGDHGNCPDASVWPRQKTARQIAAGCATSFVFFT